MTFVKISDSSVLRNPGPAPLTDFLQRFVQYLYFRATNFFEMKSKTEVVIHAPREKVLEMWQSFEDQKNWQKGLESLEYRNGKPGYIGTQLHYSYKLGRKRLDMQETLIQSNLPTEYQVLQEAEGVINRQKHYITEPEPGKTLWTTITETRFKRWGLRFMGWLSPGLFEREQQKIFEAFRDYVEGTV